MTQRKIIRKLRLSEISHVGNPMNKQSTVALWKSADQSRGEDDMQKLEELEKSNRELEAKFAALTKSFEESAASLAALRGAVEKAEMTIVEKSGETVVLAKSAPDPNDFIVVEGQSIAKSSIPAPILAQLEKTQRENQEFAKAAERVAIEKRASETFKHLPGDVSIRAALLKSVDAIGDEKVRDEVMKSLAAADAAVGKTFLEKGSDDPDTLDDKNPAQALDKMVDEYAQKNGIAKIDAYGPVLKTAEGRALAKAAQSTAN